MKSSASYFSPVNSIASPNSSGLRAFFVKSAATVSESLVSFGMTLRFTLRKLRLLAVIGQFPNHVSILAIIRVEVLNAGKRRSGDVGVISTEQISIVVNDVKTVVELAHFHLFFASCRSPIAKQSFLHFLSGSRCDWNFIFARTESENTQANRNAEAKSAKSRGLGRVRGPVFVEIDQVRDCGNVIAIREAMFALCLFQIWRCEVTPA